MLLKILLRREDYCSYSFYTITYILIYIYIKNEWNSNDKYMNKCA